MSSTSFIKVIFSPKQTLKRQINEYNLLAPTIFVGVFSALLTSIVTLFLTKDIFNETSMKNLKIVMLCFSVVIAGISPLIGILISSIVNYIGLVSANVFVEFRKLMVIGLYAYIPVLIDSLLKVIILFYVDKDMKYSPTSISILIPGEHSYIHSFFNSFSISGIWSLFIYYIGTVILIKESYSTNKKKAIIIVLFINVLLTLVASFVSYISGNSQVILSNIIE